MAAAKAGRDVVLINGSVRCRREHGETLPPEARQSLRDLGLVDGFDALLGQPCWANRSVWGSARLQTWETVNNPYGTGWHVERRRLEEGLRDAALDAGARLVTGSVRRVQPGERAMHLELNGGAHIEASYVVDATGRSAVIARQLGARRRQYDRLVGMTWHHEADPDPATLVEAVPEGWWYSAPTAAGMIVIFFGDADLADWLQVARHPSELLDHAPHTRARLAVAGPGGAPALVSASTSILGPMRGRGWVAVGDAVATYDPLGAYGILHSLMTGQQVAAVVGEGRASDMADYEKTERDRFDEHLRQRRAHYGVERRWPGAEFWQRRACD
jgi:flavin-dependent dehydrogenase